MTRKSVPDWNELSKSGCVKDPKKCTTGQVCNVESKRCRKSTSDDEEVLVVGGAAYGGSKDLLDVVKQNIGGRYTKYRNFAANRSKSPSPVVRKSPSKSPSPAARKSRSPSPAARKSKSPSPAPAAKRSSSPNTLVVKTSKKKNCFDGPPIVPSEDPRKIFCNTDTGNWVLGKPKLPKVLLYEGHQFVGDQKTLTKLQKHFGGGRIKSFAGTAYDQYSPEQNHGEIGHQHFDLPEPIRPGHESPRRESPRHESPRHESPRHESPRRESPKHGSDVTKHITKCVKRETKNEAGKYCNQKTGNFVITKPKAGTDILHIHGKKIYGERHILEQINEHFGGEGIINTDPAGAVKVDVGPWVGCTSLAESQRRPPEGYKYCNADKGNWTKTLGKGKAVLTLPSGKILYGEKETLERYNSYLIEQGVVKQDSGRNKDSGQKNNSLRKTGTQCVDDPDFKCGADEDCVVDQGCVKRTRGALKTNYMVFNNKKIYGDVEALRRYMGEGDIGRRDPDTVLFDDSESDDSPAKPSRKNDKGKEVVRPSRLPSPGIPPVKPVKPVVDDNGGVGPSRRNDKSSKSDSASTIKMDSAKGKSNKSLGSKEDEQRAYEATEQDIITNFRSCLAKMQKKKN